MRTTTNYSDSQDAVLGDRSGSAKSAGRGFFILLAAGVGVMTLVNLGGAGPDTWSSDFGSAEQSARAENRPLLVGFFMKNCPPCLAMDREVLHQEQVVKVMSEFVLVKVDLNRQAELAERFDVHAAPTFMVLSPDGSVRGGFAGYRPADAFVAWLERYR